MYVHFHVVVYLTIVDLVVHNMTMYMKVYRILSLVFGVARGMLAWIET